MKQTIIFFFVGCILSAQFLLADNSTDIAIILKVKGEVLVQRVNTPTWDKAEMGMHLNSGDLLKTGDEAFAAIMFTDDKSLIKVRVQSTITISGTREKSSIDKRLNLPIGEMWLKVKKHKSSVAVETPTGIAAVKGTEFYAIVDTKGNTTLHGIEGTILLKNDLGETPVTAGQTGLATKEKAPTSHKSIKSQLPTWATDDRTEHEIKVEFDDQHGNKKTLKIIYEKE